MSPSVDFQILPLIHVCHVCHEYCGIEKATFESEPLSIIPTRREAQKRSTAAAGVAALLRGLFIASAE